MKNRIVIVISIILLTSSTIFGQKISNCDRIYDFVEQMPKYNDGISDLMKYVQNELFPIISDCMKTETSLITNLNLVVTVNKNGQIIEAAFPRYYLTAKCKNKLKLKLLSMSGWQPGQMDGKNVCVRIRIPINCIKME